MGLINEIKNANKSRDTVTLKSSFSTLLSLSPISLNIKNHKQIQKISQPYCVMCMHVLATLNTYFIYLMINLKPRGISSIWTQ